MSVPVIDAIAVATPESTTSTQDEIKAADLLTFKIGMATVAAVVFIMAIVGAVTASPALLMAAGLSGTMASLGGVYTGVNLLAA
ncbi:mandelate racemase [Actinomyces sp. MRS3W]|uniref:mandelate racemase n=1 Tax=Actinomyces sp. MRS3W TaxID=2800796 RepID=UPI0028FD5A2F|nr:mandelate racemase [Actinomyces sp. MRS3W]MDU0349473.1 mandelate racemase [Actinomyces sp. MRS3W]